MTKLHDLPEDHPLRNAPLCSIESVRIVCRHTGGKRDPRAWKIGKLAFNALGDTWTTNFDFTVEAAP